MDPGDGRYERHKVGVEDLDEVCLAGEGGVDDFLRDGKGVLGVGVLSAFKLITDGVRATIRVRWFLIPNKDQVQLISLRLDWIWALGLLGHEGVVAAAEAVIASDDNNGCSHRRRFLTQPC